MPTRSVDLTQHLDHFVEAGIKSGRFRDASELVREALLLLEQREAEEKATLESLRADAAEGFNAVDRGDYTVLHSANELDQFLKSIHEEVSAELTNERKGA